MIASRAKNYGDGPATQWDVVWVAFGSGVVAAAHVGKLPPALPDLQMELGVGLVTAGWIASMISATGCTLGLVAGSIADRLGHRAVLVFGLLSLAVGGLMGALAPSGEVMLISRFIEGVGFTSTTVSGAAIIARATSHSDRKWALGVWAVYMPMGFAGMMVLGAVLLQVSSWRVLWGVGCILSLFWIVVVLRATANWRPDRAPQTGAGLGLRAAFQPLRYVGAVLVALSFGLYATQHIAMMNWLPTYMREVHNSGALIAAVIPAVVLSFNAAGNFVAAWAMGRGCPIWVLLTIGSGGMAVAEVAVLSGYLPDILKLAAVCVFGLAGGLIPAAALAAAPVYARSPAVIGSMSGLMVMGSNTGQLIGPPALAAARQSAGSWDGTGWLLLSLAIGAALLSVLSRPMENRTYKSVD